MPCDLKPDQIPNMQTNIKNPTKSPGGFSLVELLIVVAVIGIIASIAIPSIGSVTNASKTATYQRNAQSIVSTFQSGQAAGVAWDTSQVRDTIIAAVVSGLAPTSGPYSGKTFKVPYMSATDITNAKAYIVKDTDGSLVYDAAGGH